MKGGSDNDRRRPQIGDYQYSCGQWSYYIKGAAQEFGVTRRTILHDVSVLSYGYPIYTKPGESGGIFIMDSYKPYNNTLTPVEQERLKKMYDAADGEDKKFSNVSCGNTVHIGWNCS